MFEPHQRPRCFIEQETLPLLLSTGWFHERIRALGSSLVKYDQNKIIGDFVKQGYVRLLRN